MVGSVLSQGDGTHMSPMDKPRTAAVQSMVTELFPKSTCKSEICSRQFPGLSKMRGLVKAVM